MVVGEADAVLRRARDVLAELGSLDLDAVGDIELGRAVMRAQELRGALEAADAAVAG